MTRYKSIDPFYKSIYPFEVLDKVKNGEHVFMTDREKFECSFVNNTPAAFVLKAVNDDTGRFEFWIKDEIGITEDNEE